MKTENYEQQQHSELHNNTDVHIANAGLFSDLHGVLRLRLVVSGYIWVRTAGGEVSVIGTIDVITGEECYAALRVADLKVYDIHI